MPAEDAPDLKNEEWVLPDNSFDPELDLSPEPATPPRDPKTGQVIAPEPKALEPPARQTHSRRLTQMALDLGISQEDIDSTPTDRLDDRVYDLNRQLLAMNERERRLAPQNGTSPTPPPTPEPSPDELDALGELKDELDPRLAKLLRDLVRENKELKGSVGEVRGHIQQKANESYEELMDRVFAENGDPAKFGEGGIKRVKAEEARRRQRIEANARAEAGPRATPQQIAQKAVEIMQDFGHAKKENGYGDKPRISKEDWNEAGLLRPTQREASREPKGTRRAERAVKSQLQDMNIPLDDAGGIEEAGLPD